MNHIEKSVTFSRRSWLFSKGLRSCLAMAGGVHAAEALGLFSLPSAEFKAMLERNSTLGYAIMTKMAEMISRRVHSLTATLIEARGEAFGVDTV